MGLCGLIGRCSSTRTSLMSAAIRASATKESSVDSAPSERYVGPRGATTAGGRVLATAPRAERQAWAAVGAAFQSPRASHGQPCAWAWLSRAPTSSALLPRKPVDGGHVDAVEHDVAHRGKAQGDREGAPRHDVRRTDARRANVEEGAAQETDAAAGPTARLAEGR